MRGLPMANQQYLYLTTIGHKTGNPHEIEIWYVEYADCYYLVSEKRDNAHWVQNIRANSAITFRVGADTFEGLGTIPTDETIVTAVKAKMEQKYKWSDGLVVQLCANR